MKTFFLFLLILPLVIACASGPSKGQLDDEVRRLCAIDGGIKVYETVKLPAERFEKDGSIYIPPRQMAKPNDEYYYDYFKHYMNQGNPEMWRSHTKVYRQSDGKLLGETVSYARRGGDMPGPWHESSFRCPQNEDSGYLMKQIFIKN